MKRFIIFAAALLVAVAPLGAQSKNELKSAKSEAASAAKSINKEGFKMIELGDLQVRLEQFFLKVNSGCTQIVGMAENCVSANLAKVTALNNAANEYAANAGGAVRGRITSDVSSITGEQVDAIVAAYERIIYKEIQGELVPYVNLLKTRKKGGYDARVYCLVDLNGAHQARLRAMERALEETNFAERYGTQVSDWIDKGFDKLQ